MYYIILRYILSKGEPCSFHIQLLWGSILPDDNEMTSSGFVGVETTFDTFWILNIHNYTQVYMICMYTRGNLCNADNLPHTHTHTRTCIHAGTHTHTHTHNFKATALNSWLLIGRTACKNTHQPHTGIPLLIEFKVS